MSRPTRATATGQAYLDLQNHLEPATTPMDA